MIGSTMKGTDKREKKNSAQLSLCSAWLSWSVEIYLV
jgi:hypothetical protein